MPRRTGAVRFLAPNHDTWTPAAVAFLDSETRTEHIGPLEREVLRCWAAKFYQRRHRRRAGEISVAEGTTRDQAAAALDAWAMQDKSTWLYAHNVAFDLVTTDLATQLAARSWELSSRHAVTGSAPWLVLHKGRQEYTYRSGGKRSSAAATRVKWQHTLTVVDSFSLMPVALDLLAQHAPYDKPPLPHDDAPLAAWLARCHADVNILAWAVLTLMDWWDTADLGKWSVSGAACGWNSYRHKIGPREVVIDPDPAILAWEHRTIFGGRRDVMRCGQLPPGRYAEIDFQSAYPLIAATQLLPRKRIGKLTPQIAQAILGGKCKYGMLAEVELETSQPRWPLRALDRVFYPVGRFRTYLAGPEIADAHRLGCLRDVLGGWFYSMSDHMQEWARWVLAVQAQPDDQLAAPIRIWAKGAGRSVCGKWAQAGWSTSGYTGPPGDGWSYEDVWIAGSDSRASVCGLAGQYYLSVADQEGEHEFPAVLAYIESHTRSRLNTAMDTSPAGAIIQCDTDGFMASLVALEDGLAKRLPWLSGPDSRQQLIQMQLDSWATLCAPLSLRIKTVFRQAVVYGAQHVVIDGKPRFSGVPASAWQTGEHSWAARLWPGLSWQIQHGQEGGYARPIQPYLVVGPYAAGWVTDSGAVRAVEVAPDAAGSNRVLPWPETRWAAAGDRLDANQAGWVQLLDAQEWARE